MFDRIPNFLFGAIYRSTFMDLTATYSPDDNKLRLYSSCPIDEETYARLRYEGFTCDPEQQVFVAHMWSPGRADALHELCGSIEDEDKSLVRQVKEPADRFRSSHEGRVRKDADCINRWDTSKYWTARAEAAIGAGKYQGRPDVRLARIRELEVKQRDIQHSKSQSERLLKAWSMVGLTSRDVAHLVHHDRGYFVNPTVNKGGTTLWDASHGFISPKPTVEQMAAKAIQNHEGTIALANRWLDHYINRHAYEKAMFVAEGGIIPEIAPASAFSTGIQTPRGPITGSHNSSSPIRQTPLGQSLKRGMRL